METHIVYIVTDSNRAYLEVGYCSDMPARLQEIHNTSSILFNGSPKLNNVVYMEIFDSKEKALSYHSTLRHFTRMQREKLIRLKNPNWLNLNISPANRNRLESGVWTTNRA
ncbi:GIY-YIG nuclease family protein [Sphingobacterium phlebotomi]|uniref:GIY-YIG nuclease family protein n=1 Tax=Sphingobacterium phlebotomi TaxID=2605433 RepID=A0A5D4H7I5_9SPHI|nr:GIY-YIG nuclease family protein [Sphingobacterium phlebotomi]TYR36494.1 GIY-YIG nuclease family protein [Sphingobacterium phlebotomi]